MAREKVMGGHAVRRLRRRTGLTQAAMAEMRRSKGIGRLHQGNCGRKGAGLSCSPSRQTVDIQGLFPDHGWNPNAAHIRSTATAVASPPPMHKVAMPRLRP